MISVNATRSKKSSSQALLKVLTCRICEILLLEATKFGGSLLCINNNSLPSICPHAHLTGMPGSFLSVFSQHPTGGLMAHNRLTYKGLQSTATHNISFECHQHFVSEVEQELLSSVLPVEKPRLREVT